jgi:hypothetical protein
MATDYEKATDFLKKVLRRDTQGPSFERMPPEQKILAGVNKPLPQWVQGFITGGVDNAPGAAMGAIEKLAKGSGKAREAFDAFKGLPHDAPVRKLNDSLNQLHEAAQRANQAGLWRQVENFIAPLISDAHDVVNSHVRTGKPLRLPNEAAFPGKMSTKLEGRATADQIKQTHETVANAIDALDQMIQARGGVIPPKPTGSAAEFLENRLRENAETPKPAQPAKTAPSPMSQLMGESAPQPAPAPKLVSEPAPAVAKNDPMAQLMGEQPKPPTMSNSGIRIKDPEMYISQLVELSKSPNLKLDPKNVAKLQQIYQEVQANPGNALPDELNLLHKVLTMQGIK